MIVWDHNYLFIEMENAGKINRCPSPGMKFFRNDSKEYFPFEIASVICTSCHLVISEGRVLGCCGNCFICKNCDPPNLCCYTQEQVPDKEWDELEPLNVYSFENDSFLCDLCGQYDLLKNARNHFGECEYKEMLLKFFKERAVLGALEEVQKFTKPTQAESTSEDTQASQVGAPLVPLQSV